jgi:hypothetical protein
MPPVRPGNLRTASRGAGLLLLVVLLGACQVSVSDDTLDADKLELEVGRGIEEQTGIQVESVDCPDDVQIQAGDTFTCTVTAEDGSTAPVDVTQQDDEGNVTWEIRSS